MGRRWMQRVATQKEPDVTTTIVHDLSVVGDHIVIPFPLGGRTKQRAMQVRPDYEEDIVSGF